MDWRLPQRTGGRVSNDRKLLGNAALSVMTSNYHQLINVRALQTNHSCKVRNDNELIALTSSTQSDCVEYWSENLALGQLPTALDTVAPHPHIKPNGKMPILRIPNLLGELQLRFAGHSTYTEDCITTLKDVEIQMIACGSAMTTVYRFDCGLQCCLTSTATTIPAMTINYPKRYATALINLYATWKVTYKS